MWTCVEGSGGYTWNHEREGPSQLFVGMWCVFVEDLAM